MGLITIGEPSGDDNSSWQSVPESSFSDGGLSLAYESSVLPDTCVPRGPALPGGFSDRDRSLAYKSAVLLDTSVTYGLVSLSGLSGVGVESPVSRSNRSCARYFPRNIA